MDSENGAIAVVSIKEIKQQEFGWMWKIDKFKLHNYYARHFSLMNGELVMKVEMRNYVHKNERSFSEPFWCFEKIPKSWNNKLYHMTVTSDNDSHFYSDTLDFLKIQTKMICKGSDSNKLCKRNLKYALNEKKALELVFELTIRDAAYQEEPTIPKPDENIFAKIIKKLLEEKMFTDFTFVVEGEKIFAHKALLASRSDVFNEIFAAKDEAKEQEIANITGVSKTAFKNFLVYLYTDKIGHINDNLADYLKLAHKLNMGELKEKCVEILANDLKESTAVDTFKNAVNYQLNDELKFNAFKFIQQKFAEMNHSMDDGLIKYPDQVLEVVTTYQEFLEILNKLSAK